MTTPAPGTAPVPGSEPPPLAASGSALSGGAESPHDWLPERYRVAKDDKSLDVEASARKLAGAYGELAKRMKDVGLPPETPDAYDVKELPEGLNFEELKKDPKMQTWLKGAHAKGMTNAQIQHVLSGLADVALGDRELTADDCLAELRKSWASPADFNRNQAAAYRAATRLGEQVGVTFAEIESAGLGNHPLFIRIMAKIGEHMREDGAPNAPGTPAPQDWQGQIDAIQKQLDELPKHDGRRRELNDQKLKLYEQKFGTKRAAAFAG
ncbi:MAG: hypothetical protein IT518_20230 [Burkholderiales bacterium]|nr:hypothetical protein [Burkholderiales bacterium]